MEGEVYEYNEDSLRSRAAYYILIGGIVLIYGVGPAAVIVWLLWPAIRKLLFGG